MHRTQCYGLMGIVVALMWAVYGLGVAVEGVNDGDEQKEADACGLVPLGGSSAAKTTRMGDVELIDTGDGVFTGREPHTSYQSNELHIIKWYWQCRGNQSR